MNRVVLLLGSNLGKKNNNISKALTYIDKEVGEIKSKSDIFKTSPEGYNSENYYLNMGIIINTKLSPIQLLKILKKIEYKLGRISDSSISGKYEDRFIDIDIIYLNNINFISKKLSIPHTAHTSKREFSKKILQQLS